MNKKTKKCTVCGETKEIDLFYRNSSQKDGRHYSCKACEKAHRKDPKRKTIAEPNADKTCSKCGITKKVSDFYRNSSSYDGRAHSCKICNEERKRLYRAKYPERHKRSQRNTKIKRAYGIDIETYDKMYEDQGGCCFLCGGSPSDRTLAVDHCHESGNVGKLLCGNCNLGLGNFKDSIEVLEKAIEYLKIYREKENDG